MNDPLGLSPEQRRAAEERLVARYEVQLMRTMELPLDRRSGPRRYDPIWPLADGRIRATRFRGRVVRRHRHRVFAARRLAFASGVAQLRRIGQWVGVGADRHLRFRSDPTLTPAPAAA
jgi:hypothetical protein